MVAGGHTGVGRLLNESGPYRFKPPGVAPWWSASCMTNRVVTLSPLNLRGKDSGVGAIASDRGGGDETRSRTVVAAARRWGDVDGPWLSEALRRPGEGT